MGQQRTQGQLLLVKMLANLNSWDQDVIKGSKIIEENQGLLLNYQATQEPMTETDYQIIQEVVERTNQINQSLKIAQVAVVKELTQVTKKDKIVEGYLLKSQDSHFIDKDF